MELLRQILSFFTLFLAFDETTFLFALITTNFSLNLQEILMIKNMPNYFADYDTIVHFVSEQELKQNHNKMPHGGFVIRSGNTTDEHKHVLELSIKLDSNPEFTSSVLTAYARAIAKLAKEGKTGAVTVFDIPLSYLSSKSPEDLCIVICKIIWHIFNFTFNFCLVCTILKHNKTLSQMFLTR